MTSRYGTTPKMVSLSSVAGTSRQGTGLALTMVGAAEEYCRKHGCKYMDLAVLGLRPELLPLYHKLGYAENGTEEFRPSRPLNDGVDCHCIIMTKYL